jgi:hypothetical protein
MAQIRHLLRKFNHVRDRFPQASRSQVGHGFEEAVSLGLSLSRAKIVLKSRDTITAHLTISDSGSK